MNTVYESRFDKISGMIGKTPLLEIHFTYKGEPRRIFAKAEYFNLSGSIKDRVAFHIMKKAYEKGEIAPDDIIAEATSGNTGIRLYRHDGKACGGRRSISPPSVLQ